MPTTEQKELPFGLSKCGQVATLSSGRLTTVTRFSPASEANCTSASSAQLMQSPLLSSTSCPSQGQLEMKTISDSQNIQSAVDML